MGKCSHLSGHSNQHYEQWIKYGKSCTVGTTAPFFIRIIHFRVSPQQNLNGEVFSVLPNIACEHVSYRTVHGVRECDLLST